MHLLLLHGAIGAADQLQPLASELQKNYIVHTLDFSGHGGSPFPAKPWSISLFAEEVLSYMDDHSIGEAAIFGYSMGGYVGMYLAAHHKQRITHVITLATKFSWDPLTAQKEIKNIDPEKIEEKVPAFAKALEQRHQPNDWREVLQRTAQLITTLGDQPPLTPDIYASVSTPALILLGDRDKMVSLEETLAVYKALPNAQLAALPGTPHPIEQTNPQTLAFLLRQYL